MPDSVFPLLQSDIVLWDELRILVLAYFSNIDLQDYENQFSVLLEISEQGRLVLNHANS